jgi:hypothetical protein
MFFKPPIAAYTNNFKIRILRKSRGLQISFDIKKSENESVFDHFEVKKSLFECIGKCLGSV